MKKSAKDYLDRSFSPTTKAEVLQYRSEIEQLLKQLHEAALKWDFDKARLMVSKIRAAFDYWDTGVEPGTMKSRLKRSYPEKDVWITHMYLCESSGLLPTRDEVIRKTQELARRRKTSYTGPGIRKIIERLRLPCSSGDPGRPRNP
jgi:hypothetical protein